MEERGARVIDVALEGILQELHRSGRARDAALSNRLERLRNVEPETARLLGVLVRATRARRLLELGTSNGYSTLWLADGARASRGSLTGVDTDAPRLAEAEKNLRRAGLRSFAELRCEDARATLASSPDAHWDFVFLDAERTEYVGYWPELVRTLSAGGMLVVDNAISHAAEVADFRDLIERDTRVMVALAPVGAGVLLVVRQA